MEKKRLKKNSRVVENGSSNSGRKRKAIERSNADPIAYRKAKKAKAQLEQLRQLPDCTVFDNVSSLRQANLFKLQTGELLKEGRIGPKAKAHIDTKLELIQKALKSIKERGTVNSSYLDGKEVEIPFMRGETSDNWWEDISIHYGAPQSTNVIGSYALGFACKTDFIVDLAIEMPKGVLKKKDFQDMRYHRKKALYLAILASDLKPKLDQLEGLVMEFSCANNDYLRPSLILKFPDDLIGSLTVQILPYPASDKLKLSHFFITTNNLNPGIILPGEVDVKCVSTPGLNVSAMTDLTIKVNHDYLVAMLSSFPALIEALLLLKVWAHQRQLDQDFSGFLLSMFMCYLLDHKKISSQMNCYQIIRNVWLNFVTLDWSRNGISLCSTLTDSHAKPDFFLSLFPTVFLDPSGFNNMTANVTLETYLRIKTEAELTLKYLDLDTMDSFDYIFMRAVPFSLQYDVYFTVEFSTDEDDMMALCRKLELLPQVVANGGNKTGLVASRIIDFTKKAMGNRVDAVGVLYPRIKSWLTKNAPPNSDRAQLTIGLRLNPDYAFKNLERGPPADNPEALEFRSFWGEISDLRQMPDGNICEAVVWPGKTAEDKRHIWQLIVRHILNRHLGIRPECIKCLSTQLEAAAFESRHDFDATSSEVVKVFDNLSKQLRNLKDLQIPANAVYGLSPIFRCSAIEAPQTFNGRFSKYICYEESRKLKLFESRDSSPPYIEAFEVLLQMETKKELPKSYEAIRRVKAALYLRIGELMAKECEGIAYNASLTHVDILMEGYVFRVKVSLPKEYKYMRTSVVDGVEQLKDTEQSKTFQVETSILPTVTSALNGLQMQYGSFSTTCRLAKKWLASQLLLETHISGVLVELIVAYLFLNPAPFSAPNHPISGFLRFLNLVSTFDWKSSCMIVNFNESFTKEGMSDIRDRFMATRSTQPAWFIITPYDRKQQSVWTRGIPEFPTLARFAKLAKTSFDWFSSNLQTIPSEAHWKALFKPSLDSYDYLIHLNEKQIGKRQCLEPTGEQPKWPYFPVVNFDQVQYYVRDLKAAFGDIALFFYDVTGGDIIAVLLRPGAITAKQFKPANSLCLKPTTKGNCGLNVDALVNDFKIIGNGLVSSITRKK